MKKFVLVILFSITFLIQQFNAHWLEQEMKTRLPVLFEPEKYEIDISTDVKSEKPEYYGEVTVTIKCVTTTNRLVMNKKFLDIDSLKVLPKDNSEGIIWVKHKDSSLASNQIKLLLNRDLRRNNLYEVKVKYHKSWFMDKLVSYPFKPYEEPSLHPNIHYLAFTQIREVEARGVFPCWDQIGMKSAFAIRLRHPAGVKSFSNAKKLANSDPIDEPKGWVMDQFADIDSMSTFSVAFVVADYNSIGPAKISDGVPYIEIKLWAETEDVLKKMEVVMNVTSQIYTIFFNYFRMPHKLGKLDLIVMPEIHDVIQDSYGLIILRQNDFLNAFDEANLNIPQKYHTLSRLCNAMSRQWIGHSVTMRAWNETWLHFGINAFLQKLCISNLQIFNEWRSFDEHLLVESFFALLRTEERGDYSPIVSLEKGSFFTAHSNSPMTYSKVHHVIRMLNFILESEKDVFRKSLENYVKKFEDGITDVDKTWEIFTKTVNEEDSSLLPDGITIKMIMDSWLTQKGHPLINVSIDKSTNDIIVTQEPFSFSNTGKSQIYKAYRPCWIIPLTYATKENMNFQNVKVQRWMKCDRKPLRIKNVNEDKWVLFNLKVHVPCRVNYEYPIWLSIQKSIQKSIQNPEEFFQVDVLTRMHLTSDMFALAEAEKLSYKYVFTTVKYILEQEENYDCWKVAFFELNRIRLRWNGTELHSHFMQYVRDILRSVLKKRVLKEKMLTFEEFLKTERQNDALEILMIMAACTFETVECVQLSHRLLGEWKQSTFGEYSELVPVDLRKSVFCLAVKNADMMERDFLFGMYNADYGSNFDKVILNALGCSGKKEMLEKYLMWGINFKDSQISPKIGLNVFEALSLNAMAYPIIIHYLENQYRILDKNLLAERTGITLEYFLIKAIDATKTRQMYKKLIAILSTMGRKNDAAANMVAESRSKAERNIYWLERKKEETIKYFILK